MLLPTHPNPSSDARVRFPLWANPTLRAPASQLGWPQFLRTVVAGYATNDEASWRNWMAWRYVPSLKEITDAGLSRWYGFDNAIAEGGSDYNSVVNIVKSNPAIVASEFWAGYAQGQGSTVVGAPDTLAQLARDAPGRAPDRVLTEEDFGIFRDPNFVEYPGSETEAERLARTGGEGTVREWTDATALSPYAARTSLIKPTIDAPVRPNPSLPTANPNIVVTGVPLVKPTKNGGPVFETLVAATTPAVPAVRVTPPPRPEEAAAVLKWVLVAVAIVIILAMATAARRR